ncbi:chemotaxis protein CheD [Methanosarcina sp. 2.H.T.1A.6]|uniref:chemotaxis protein CheD n=1 Tax=unclassified Methanosarcina TaxID=2644672 RepID=UPI000622692C|nr:MULTISPECIES: chemotaxis protein CheD [unclassified Methanosarcina]KKG15617.1 chemotaxis protein CheD [Methanosarcina sp. 2.H.T.1A.3]KKG19521.1 chemotaxis protein CheD [Methanosarcina sp. 2.H.T.1A.6]KKG27518.1 chemotaxis protein CheD [Methanosarcina sp. 2.H.T.1A.8]KKG28451.1 chemotaxis protein CheD [Methanosarcina sp. 2.H.T.1A.15]
MSGDILFVSNESGKAVFLTSGDVLLKSFCSLSNTCSSRDSCRSCDMINGAKSHMMGTKSNLNIKSLDGELSAGIGEYKIGKNVLLKVMGLGSCIGVILSDVSTGICGIAHVLLPGASNNGETKYAETAIEKMFEDMIKMGARKSRITAKFAGGAQVFKHMSLDILKIGNRNAISVEETLIKKNIPILAKDVGGEVGRSVIFNPVDGSMIVKPTKGDVLWL